MTELKSSFPCVSLLLVRLFIIICVSVSQNYASPSTTAYGSTAWRNNVQALDSWSLSGPVAGPVSVPVPITVRPILVSANVSQDGLFHSFGCGFLCYGTNCESYLFSTFLAIYSQTNANLLDIQMVWSANRDHLVQDNATLTLTSAGDLLLKDKDGSLVWSANSNISVAQAVSMKMEESGNLVVLNSSNGSLWQSFDHPTDTIVMGQKLLVGQKLVASVSDTNTSQGNFYASLLTDRFALFIDSNPPEPYYMFVRSPASSIRGYAEFDQDWLLFYVQPGSNPAPRFAIPKNSLFAKVDSEGHFRFYTFLSTTGKSSIDYFTDFTQDLSACDYPKVCGDYGVCTDGECSCPKGVNGDHAFVPVQESIPSSGCLPPNPLVCPVSDISTSFSTDSYFLEMDHVSYFTYEWGNDTIPDLITREACKILCLRNCSCTAAFFRYGGYANANFSHGYCYLETNVYSLRMNSKPTDDFYSSIAYLRIQPTPEGKDKHPVAIISACVAGGVIILLALLLLAWRCSREKQKEEDSMKLPGASAVRYSFKDLEIATDNFKTKLGNGGFGSVYEGVLSDGTKIAVKRLDRAGQGTSEFRAEVETLGGIHHLNLVRLMGFCAENSHRILVYEYLSNGSLDQWIFPRKGTSEKPVMDWNTRSKVALHTAKGLAYLHEECRERIIHFDIKPQNILLDQNFNAKVSDFGLAKLISRDESEVITMLRGTPGYIAPEWLSSHVTEKADTYSFGVTLIEIVSGKRNMQLTKPDYDLISLLQDKAEQRELADLVDPDFRGEEMEEALKMIELAIWCIHRDYRERPAMSTVVKALEGTIHSLPPAISSLSN
ncbi:G-type lectin S-receptor-like serine/threonine-protein kinase SD2-5 [Cryptomeria japonica]|uniref:G-type lectin S-receptor-like serine/threonine-protein kinase SD2-5 n=1 Tax=Cryptomeria japonica TaxID=3369 RepID=UPI0027DA0614|nr:G-type lectin S-receptor-like serine/threonine-protein kinase SD2-5 [Cryptomeria japonica]